MADTLKRKNYYLMITVFIAGMATMSVEFAASRLLGNVFGTSNIVWAVIIGLILVYLMLGYWIGGRLADKYPYEKTLYNVLIAAGFWIGLVPLISRPILRLASDAFDQMEISILLGSFLAVVLLFVVPVTLLGTASPISLKLLIDDTKTTGKVTGRFSAISTFGGIFGTFLTVLVFIPIIGSYKTFIVISEIIVLLCLIGLLRSYGWRSTLPYLWMPIVVVLAGVLSLRGTDKGSEGVIFETESAYNYIQVLEIDGYRYLRLNEGQGMHSVYHPEQLFYNGPWSQVLVAPLFNENIKIDRVAFIGLAAGTSARQFAIVYPDIVMDGYEIDPDIVEVGQKYFGMTHPNLNVYIEDGRWGIAHSNKYYNVISVDAYKAPYIPAHMTTLEFFKELANHLFSNGMLVINVGRSPLNRDLVNDLASTVLVTFPKVFVVDIPDTFNTVIFASKSNNASWDLFFKNAESIQDSNNISLLNQAVQVTLAGRASPPTQGRVYTDDLSLIEWITNRIVMDYVLSGEAESLQ